MCTSNFLDVKDIRASLGEPIYSRLDDVIRFNSIYDGLDEEDKKRINRSQVLNELSQIANNIKNAREVDKVIKDYIFTKITVQRFMKDS